MASREANSWGRVFQPRQQVVSMGQRHASLPLPPTPTTLLPFGNGRSYGDSNLNPGGTVVATGALNRLIRFDRERGQLSCDAGVLLSDILDVVVPAGWFLPVVPGTQYVSVGGAIANDVHGKNHHRVGSFGNHVIEFELLRSDGTRRLCSPTDNPLWFDATIGGLGLTGMITWATLQLRRITSPWIDVQSLRFNRLEDFFAISRESDEAFEYTVAWIDCAFAGRRLGRGIFYRGNHAADAPTGRAHHNASRSPWRVPVTPPWSMINSLTLKLLNTAYFHKQWRPVSQAMTHYQPFFFPLDAVGEWNRVYGPRGFYQYQCALPSVHAVACTRELLQATAASGLGSFLAVLKQFGPIPSRGLLSFPMQGTTLALDFPNVGDRVHRLFEQLDRLVLQAGGRLYPAKDGRMGGALFKQGYPRWQEFAAYVDPRFSSGFWRRVMETI